jgi:transposase InsO family protein
VKTVVDALGVAHSNLTVQAAPSASRSRRGRQPQPEDELLTEIKQTIAGQPSHGYRRIHALIQRRRAEHGGAAVNVKRLYRVMKAHGLLLECHAGRSEESRHDGRVAADRSDTRWCSDGFEIGCDAGERVRIAFTLDCCDREAIAWVATTGGVNSGDIRDLMIESVERRFGFRGPVAILDRAAVGHRLALYRPRDACAGARHRPGAANNADREPTIERHGRGLCQKPSSGITPGSTRAMMRAVCSTSSTAGSSTTTRSTRRRRSVADRRAVLGKHGGEDDRKSGRRSASTA